MFLIPSQLPKPRWVERSLRAKALLLSTPPGLWGRRIALLAHLSLIIRCAKIAAQLDAWLPAALLLSPCRQRWSRPVFTAWTPSLLLPPGCREVWRNLFAPGTFRGVLRNAWRTLSTGERFEWPTPIEAAAPAALAIEAAPAPAAADSWYITAKDLAHFKWTIEEDGGPAGASAWEPMMEKQWPGCTYTAWRRTLPSGKSEYKSVTVSGEQGAGSGWDGMGLQHSAQAGRPWNGLLAAPRGALRMPSSAPFAPPEGSPTHASWPLVAPRAPPMQRTPPLRSLWTSTWTTRPA